MSSSPEPDAGSGRRSRCGSRATGRRSACGAFTRRADIRERAAVDAAFAAAASANGPVHALVANSGIGGPNEAGEADRF